MEKLLTIFVIDGARDVKFSMNIIPMLTVRQVLRKLGLEGFNLLKINGRPIPNDADIFAEVESGGKVLALWNGGRSKGEDFPDDG